jgi:glutamate/tyrosine decarboxylase-like PLP-dependent enzyme
MEYTGALKAAFEGALEFLHGIESCPVRAIESAASLRERLDCGLAIEGSPAEDVVRDLIANVRGGLLRSQSDRFFAWVIGGAIPSAVAADWLAAAWDQNAAVYNTSPGAAIVEEIAGEWLKQIFRLPAHAAFAFVTGTQMAHVTCLASARNALLERSGWNVESKGLNGAPAIRVISSTRRHPSIDRALRFLGLGTDALVLLEPGENGTLDARDVASTLKSLDAGAIVLLQAGEINTGAFDDFRTLTALAHQYRAWVHVDGAFGLWAAASPRFAHLTAGIEQADSWTADGHKWLNVPFDCGYAFVADARAHRSAMSIRAPYIVPSDDARDPLDWNPDWSRRARGFATYAAIRELGTRGIAELVERNCDSTRNLYERLTRLEGVEGTSSPVLNQALVRFLAPRPGATAGEHDRYTDRVIAAVVESGDAYFGATTFCGARAMRISVCNWRTGTNAVDRAVGAVERALQCAHLRNRRSQTCPSIPQGGSIPHHDDVNTPFDSSGWFDTSP